MAGDYGNEAADRLEQGGGGGDGGEMSGDGMGEHEPPDGSREDTFFLPPDFPGAEMLKPGDMLNLRVVGKDGQGGIEVEHVPMKGGGEPPWKQDLRKSVPNTPGGGGIGNGPEM
jgi:hypothetical protein